jgi:hypothetical protein
MLTWNSKPAYADLTELGIPSLGFVDDDPLGPRASIGVSMNLNGTAVLTRHQPGPVSPAITSEDGWLGTDGRDQPLTLQLRLPVSAEELAAALYSDDLLSPPDLATDADVWAFAAVAIVQDGLDAIQRHADEIAVAEARGELANPAWLELCRRRVAEVTGSTEGPAVTATPAGSTERAGASACRAGS